MFNDTGRWSQLTIISPLQRFHKGDQYSILQLLYFLLQSKLHFVGKKESVVGLPSRIVSVRVGKENSRTLSTEPSRHCLEWFAETTTFRNSAIWATIVFIKLRRVDPSSITQLIQFALILGSCQHKLLLVCKLHTFTFRLFDVEVNNVV